MYSTSLVGGLPKKPYWPKMISLSPTIPIRWCCRLLGVGVRLFRAAVLEEEVRVGVVLVGVLHLLRAPQHHRGQEDHHGRAIVTIRRERTPRERPSPSAAGTQTSARVRKIVPKM